MPKARHVVDYGDNWETLVQELGDPLGGEPIHSTSPEFTQPDDVYGPFVTDDGVVIVEYVPWPDDVSEELAGVILRLQAPDVDVNVDVTAGTEVTSGVTGAADLYVSDDTAVTAVIPEVRS